MLETHLEEQLEEASLQDMMGEPFDLEFGQSVEVLIKKFQRQNIRLEITFIAENCVGKQDYL